MVSLTKEEKSWGINLIRGIVCTVYAVLFYLFMCFLSA